MGYCANSYYVSPMESCLSTNVYNQYMDAVGSSE